MRFDKVFDILMEHEGGYVNDPKDPGGETKYGISERAYPNEDIKNLTPDRAKSIYIQDYWAPLRCEQMPPGIDLALFDMGVHSGIRAAAKTLQQAAGVTADGIIGPITIRAVRSKDPRFFLKMFMYARWRYVKSLPQYNDYPNGWTRRVIEIAIDAATVSGSGDPSVNLRIP